jgi:uncharacterized integral membrane protein (TIGR00698 family)
MKPKEHIPGLLLACVIAFLSVYISTIHASFDSLVISIIIGMLFNNLVGGQEIFKNGTDTAIRVFLPLGIALYGSQLSFVGMKTGLLFNIFLVFFMLFGLTVTLSRVFRLNMKITILLASGLSVCGASAIAIISPLIDAKREDTSISILSVMMLGLIGMIFYPLLYDFFPLRMEEFSFFAGTTLPMIGQVKVTAGNVNPAFVSSALQVKLVRVAFLIFLIPLIMSLSNRGEKRITVPWFIIVFVLLSFLANTLNPSKDVIDMGRILSTYCLSAGLAAIGFSVDFDAVVEEGLTPFGVILSSWTVVIIAVFLFRNIW